MQIVINNIKMPVNHKIEDVLLAAQEFVRQQCIYADNFYIYRQSIDARHKKSIKYIYSVAAEVNNGAKILPNSNLQIISQNDEIKVVPIGKGNFELEFFINELKKYTIDIDILLENSTVEIAKECINSIKKYI